MRIDRVKLAAELTRQEMTRNRIVELSGVSRATNYITLSPARAVPMKSGGK